MRILIADDDEFTLEMLSNTLSRLGHDAVLAHDGVEAMKIIRQGEVRMVITDWDMPGMNGIEVCQAVRREDLSGYVYIVIFTGREGRNQRMQGLYAGADDFLTKPLDPEELLICLRAGERILSLETRDVALFALAKLAESRDPDTGAHVDRVQAYSCALARALATDARYRDVIDDEFIRLIHQASPLHDLGKVAIPDSILLKPGRLTVEEFAVMKTHTELGAKTLGAALERFPDARFLQMARDIAATHHEHYDGSGYPLGLAGERIPLGGRIVALADVYDALTCKRVYKEPMPHAQAKEIIVSVSGSHFDPNVVAAFVRAESQFLDIYEKFRDDISRQPATLEIQPASPQTPANSYCVLIVEDDPVIREHLAKVLSATGHDLRFANDGEEALELIAITPPRIIISDWVMPKLDGLELCRTIRSRQGGEPVHFMMLTGQSDKARLIEAFDAGVDDFLAKPFDAGELLARFRAAVRSSQLHDELNRRNAGSQQYNMQLANINSRLEKLAITDELTGLFNRRHGITRLDEQWSDSERYSRPLAAAMVDIDHFKLINDTYGHDVGDLVLRRVATILQEEVRRTDTISRVGGEEMLIILPSQTIEEAAICAERCRSAVAAQRFHSGEHQFSVTVSIGVASKEPELMTSADLVKSADRALYEAKRAGRNTVYIIGPTCPMPGKPSAAA